MNIQNPALMPRSVGREVIGDLVLWLVTAILGFALVFLVTSYLRRLGASLTWFAQILQPLVTLPTLTAVLWSRGESWGTLGLRRPHNWQKFLGQTLIGFVAMVTAGYVIRHILIAPLHLRSSAQTRYINGLQNNFPEFVRLLVLVTFGVGFNEELQFRGFIQSRLEKVFGGPTRRYASVLVTGLLFGVAHLAWGPATMVNAALLGILLGVIYLWAGRNLWVPIALHSLFDVTRAIQWFLTGSDLPM
jgi:membrane protease YdiL (CAAX protease family)